MAAIDELKNLQDLLGSRVNAMNPSLSYLNGLAGNAAGAYGNAIANQNTAEGLSPAAMSALRTQATSGINDQYQSAAQSLNTQLLRRGAVGQNQLPGSGGDISRSYQPLYSAMEAAKTKATTDMILADEAAKRASLTENRANALSAANSVFGGANSIYNAQNAAISGTANIANDIASLESPDIWKLLGTSALTSVLSGGIGGNGGTGSPLTGTGLNDTGKYGVVGDLLGKLPSIGPGGTATYSSVAAAQDAAQNIGTPSIVGQIGTTAAELAAPVAVDAAVGSTGATGITGALGLGGGSGLFGLGAATIPVVGGAALGIYLLAKHFWGNGGDRMAANELTGPNGVHTFFNQATQQIQAMPEGPEKQAAYDTRDRAFEQMLLSFSKVDKDHYYQAKQTLRQFAGFSSVRALLG